MQEVFKIPSSSCPQCSTNKNPVKTRKREGKYRRVRIKKNGQRNTEGEQKSKIKETDPPVVLAEDQVITNTSNEHCQNTQTQHLNTLIAHLNLILQ